MSFHLYKKGTHTVLDPDATILDIPYSFFRLLYSIFSSQYQMIFLIRQFPEGLHTIIHIRHQTYLFPFCNKKTHPKLIRHCPPARHTVIIIVASGHDKTLAISFDGIGLSSLSLQSIAYEIIIIYGAQTANIHTKGKHIYEFKNVFRQVLFPKIGVKIPCFQKGNSLF